MYRTAESLYCTPETSITLYVNYTGIFNKYFIYLRERETQSMSRGRAEGEGEADSPAKQGARRGA